MGPPPESYVPAARRQQDLHISNIKTKLLMPSRRFDRSASDTFSPRPMSSANSKRSIHNTSLLSGVVLCRVHIPPFNLERPLYGGTQRVWGKELAIGVIGPHVTSTQRRFTAFKDRARLAGRSDERFAGWRDKPAHVR